MSTGDDGSQPRFIEGHLLKKEDRKKWVNYWAVIQERYLILYTDRKPSAELRDVFYGCIELTPAAHCVITNRKKYKFPFYIATGRARYLFKTNSNVERHRWIVAIKQASKVSPCLANGLLFPGDEIENTTKGENESEGDNSTTKPQPQDEFEENKSTDEGDSNINVEEAFKFNLSTVLVNVSDAPETQKTSRFLDRILPIQTAAQLHDSSSDDGDDDDDDSVDVTNVNHAETFAERFHQIYCQEGEEEKLTEGSLLVTNKIRPPVQTFGYPTLSKSSHKNNSMSRLTKSVDSLKGLSFGITGSHRQATSSSTSSSLNLPDLLDGNTGINSSRKNVLYSRHFVNSAPDYKSKSTR